ncbi:MAG: glucose-6-phosphate isomerase [Deltaproteobacteria bacterium]|nr:glucose-6-phosphate isomerase [Deltaproteobacteria bacterium]
METQSIHTEPIWESLISRASNINKPANHLKRLIGMPDRLKNFSAEIDGFLYDFSRQRVDSETMALLVQLADRRDVIATFNRMMSGERINKTENRAALHTACRSFSNDPIRVAGGHNVIPDIKAVQKKIKTFAHRVHAGELTGHTGKGFRHMVVIGIGGSYLGTEFVSEALMAYADKGMQIHYLSNVDIHNFGRITKVIDPETTLWIVISKSYTTAETLANEKQARAFMADQGLDATRHMISITAKGSPGDITNEDNTARADILESFHMYDFIGGRYSVSSAVGGVPLSLLIGYDRFEAFLKGAEEMDRHAAGSEPTKNIPLIAALVSIWNNNFLNYRAQAIIPYAAPLCKLAPHIQQLNMESNGKSVTAHGAPVSVPTGGVIFGEPGTNAQHSFFQLAHQGMPIPIEFIGVIQPQYTAFENRSRGVTNHQELWANLLSQPMALATGKDAPDPAKCFSGNRPSSMILLPDLSPRSVGRLLSFYESKTVFEAFLWGINPFDQFGVELGKQLATDIRREMAEKNQNSGHTWDQVDAITRYYLDALFKM